MSEALLNPAGIRLDVTASSKEEAVNIAGGLLVEIGAVSPEYVEAMQVREKAFSSYMGNGVSIPHGTDEARNWVNFGQLVFLRFKEPVIWDNEGVVLCIGIAAKADEHGEILGNLAEALLDEKIVQILQSTNNKDEILSILLKS